MQHDEDAKLEARTYLYQIFHSVFGVKANAEQFQVLANGATEEALLLFAPPGVGADTWHAMAADFCRTPFSENIASQYVRSFEGPGQMVAPPWESVYVNAQPLLFQESTIDVRRQYLAWDFIPHEFPHVPDDQLSLELDFMERLGLRACEARKNGNDAEEASALGASLDFIDGHLGRWLDEFAQRLVEGEQNFYALAAQVLGGFVEADKAFLKDLTASSI